MQENPISGIKCLTSKEKETDLPTNFKSAIESVMVELEEEIWYFKTLLPLRLYLQRNFTPGFHKFQSQLKGFDANTLML